MEGARIAPVFTRLGTVDVNGEYVFRPHRHTSYEVILVDKGRYVCTLNGNGFVLEPDEVLVVKPGDWHEDRCVPPLRYFGVAFEFAPAWRRVPGPDLFVPGVQPEMQRIRVDRDTFWPLLQRISAESGVIDDVSAQVQDALFLEFFWLLVRALPRRALSPEFLDLSFQQTFPMQLHRLFRSSVSTQLSVADMAARLGMSESSLAHKCKAILGVSAARAFMNYKMERAAVLLANTAMSVKEIGFEVGFDDPSQFSKAFRRLKGCSPSESRDRNRSPRQ
jgi:AraC-like DNA-binding protein